MKFEIHGPATLAKRIKKVPKVPTMSWNCVVDVFSFASRQWVPSCMAFSIQDKFALSFWGVLSLCCLFWLAERSRCPTKVPCAIYFGAILMIDWGGASHHVALDTPLDRMSQRFLANAVFLGPPLKVVRPNWWVSTSLVISYSSRVAQWSKVEVEKVPSWRSHPTCRTINSCDIWQ